MRFFIERLVIDTRECLQTLGTSASDEQLEKWACVIYESMSAPSRTFHNVSHATDIVVGADAIQKLAAFFHDVVYYSIDGGLNRHQRDLVQDIITQEKGTVKITKSKLDQNISMIMDVFGFKQGQELDPFKGLNEFLSACVAVRCYESCMEMPLLAKIAACIEATIPFRPRNMQGKTPEEALFKRLGTVNRKYNLHMSEEELVEDIQRAADLANRDLDNFSTTERAVFLSNTWSLLPESNISLRNTVVFRVSDFAFALKKMTSFFVHLDPELIYMSFRDEEHAAIIVKKTEIARENIEVALKYLICKSLAVAMIASLAELSGGDAPLVLFVGENKESLSVSRQMDDFIDPDFEAAKGVEIDERVLQLLRDGRESVSNFDIKNSPLAAFLYSQMGEEGVKQSMQFAVHPMDEPNARALLASMPTNVAIEVISACSNLAVTRTSALENIMDGLRGGTLVR